MVNFQSLPTVEDSQFYLDKAFSRAKKRSDVLISSRTRKTDKDALKKKVSHEKILIVHDNLIKDLDFIIDKYPSFDSLPEFYAELTRIQLDIDTLRKSLGRLQGVTTKIDELSRMSLEKIRTTEKGEYAAQVATQFYGRVSSLFKQLDPAFKIIESARRILTTFPAIRDECYTIALAGFPNVGKSTLLSKMTSSKPKIANYAFTTKILNVGYYKEGYIDMEVIDTPGTLARFETMNPIEQQAYLCLKYIADVIVMIIDPTDCYPIEEQEKLLEQVKEHDKPIIMYISKVDIVDEAISAPLIKKFDAITDQEVLKEKILEIERKQ
jgi:nucleolar GTP-binding protein